MGLIHYFGSTIRLQMALFISTSSRFFPLSDHVTIWSVNDAWSTSNAQWDFCTRRPFLNRKLETWELFCPLDPPLISLTWTRVAYIRSQVPMALFLKKKSKKKNSSDLSHGHKYWSCFGGFSMVYIFSFGLLSILIHGDLSETQPLA